MLCAARNGALAVAQRQAGSEGRTVQRIATAPQNRESLAWADQRAKSESPQRSRLRKNCENWVSESGVCQRRFSGSDQEAKPCSWDEFFSPLESGTREKDLKR